MFEYKSAYVANPIDLDPANYMQSATEAITPVRVPGVTQATFHDIPVGLTWGDAFKATLKYDTIASGIVNRLSKPNRYNKYWLESGAKEEGLKLLEAMYPSMTDNLKESYQDEVNSPEDLEWFRKVTNNKMTAEIAWSSHPTAGIVGTLAAPESVLGFGSGAWLQTSKIGTKFLRSMSKLSYRGQELAHAGLYGATGALSTAPEVMWNYEDPENMLIAGLLSAGIASGVSAGIKASKIDEGLVRAYKESVDAKKTARETYEEAVADATPEETPTKVVKGSKKTPKDAKPLGVFDRYLAQSLSLVDEVEQVFPGLGEATLGMPSRGLAHSVDSSASIQQTLSLQRQLELYKLEKSLQKINGLYEQGWKERFARMIGKGSSVLPAHELERHYQRAIAYMGTQYNRRTIADIRKSETERLMKEVQDLANELGDKTDFTPISAKSDVRGAERALNELRERKYKKDLDAYNKQYDRQIGRGTPDGIDPTTPENTKRIQDMIDADKVLYARLFPYWDEEMNKRGMHNTPTELIVRNGASDEMLNRHAEWVRRTEAAFQRRDENLGDAREELQDDLKAGDKDAYTRYKRNVEETELFFQEDMEEIAKDFPTAPVAPPKMPGRADPNPKSFVIIPEPSEDALDDIEKQIVKAYEESGLGAGLGTMINKDGVGLEKVRVDEDYFHTRFSLKAIDRVVEGIYDDKGNLVKKGLKDVMQEESDLQRKSIKTEIDTTQKLVERLNESKSSLAEVIRNNNRASWHEVGQMLGKTSFKDVPQERLNQLFDQVHNPKIAVADAEEAEAIANAKATALKNAKAHVKAQGMDLRTKKAKAAVNELIENNRNNPASRYFSGVDVHSFKSSNGVLTTRQERYYKDRMDVMQRQINAEQKKLDYLNDQLQNFPKDMSENELKTAAYRRIMMMMGRQMSDYIGHRYGARIAPEHVGAILINNLMADNGHVALRDAIDAVRNSMDRSLKDALLANIKGGEVDPELAKFIRSLDTSNILEQSTGINRMNNMKAVGEASAFKERFLWDYNEIDDRTGVALADLIDGNMYNTAIHNIEEESSRVALSGTVVDIDGEKIQLNTGENIMRVQGLIIDKAKKMGYTSESADDLGVSWADAVLGRPMGAQLGPNYQAATAAAQMIQLKNSGIYNLVELTNVMMQFGLGRAVRNFCKSIRMGLNTKKITDNDSKRLANIVSKLYAMEGRVRPEVTVITNDLTDVADTTVNRGILWFSQWTRWANGQQHTAQMEANLCGAIYEEILEDSIKSGDFSELLKMGNKFNKNEIRSMQAQYKKHGMNITDWTNYRLAQKIVRSAMDMTTNTSLMIRRGERPRFLNTSWGKVVFAYQSFIWAAHNKLLRRFKNEGGYAKAAGFVISQIPLAIIGSAVIQLLKGNDPFEDPEKMAVNVATSMSAMGLYGAILTAITRGEIGGTAPALGALSTMYQSGASAMSGDPSKLFENMPLLGAVLPYRAGLAAFGNI